MSCAQVFRQQCFSVQNPMYFNALSAVLLIMFERDYNWYLKIDLSVLYDCSLVVDTRWLKTHWNCCAILTVLRHLATSPQIFTFFNEFQCQTAFRGINQFFNTRGSHDSSRIHSICCATELSSCADVECVPNNCKTSVSLNVQSIQMLKTFTFFLLIILI